jgi:hypothetical protein
VAGGSVTVVALRLAPRLGLRLECDTRGLP